jgi:CheY-like chemotaxis protein
MITNVLLIDDDPDEHEIFSFALKKYDSKITCFSIDGRIEDLLLINFLPDVIFLDMNMPETDGFGWLRKIKKTPKFAHIPLYVYSTASYSHREREAFELGALKWVTKPKSMIGYSQFFTELFAALESTNTKNIEHPTLEVQEE